MSVIRRLYVYAVAFVSLEVVLWGVIGLARSVFERGASGGVSRLAEALSFILVGVPVFWLHWWLAQRSAAQDDEERSTRTRAVFLYGVLAATLVPAFQNALALVDRLLLVAFGAKSFYAWFGSGQSASDNLIGIALNLLAAAYFFYILRIDWVKPLPGEAFPETRRLYRYLWMLYGLVLAVSGVSGVLRSLLGLLSNPQGATPGALAANGLALLLAGGALWVATWREIQATMVEAGERAALLRLVILYALALIGLVGLLITIGIGLSIVLTALLNNTLSSSRIIREISLPLSLAVPLGGVWAYYGRVLNAEVSALEDTPRRSGLRRLYVYILTSFGLLAAFSGLTAALVALLALVIGESTLPVELVRTNLANGLASLLVGLPLWLFTWRPMAAEANLAGEAGDHARRSLVRKSFLYLALFAGVMGVMFSTGTLLYQIIRSLLGDPVEHPLLAAAQTVTTLVLFALLLAFHWRALGADARRAASLLARRHSQFPVLVLAPEQEEFAREVVTALQKQAPGMPVAVHAYSAGVPDETLSAARAVILPGELLAKPSEALRLWLQAFNGPRLVIPTPSQDWHFVSGLGRSLRSLANQAANDVRRLSEGEEIAPVRATSAWMILVYIIAGLFGLQLLFLLVTLGISFVQR